MDNQPSDVLAARAASPPTQVPDRGRPTATIAITELYQAHALGLTRMAYVMLGDRQGAEDIVQEAFCGLYRRWEKLADKGKAVPYLRSSVLNGCRSEIRRSRRRNGRQRDAGAPPEESAEAAVLAFEGRQAVLAAIMNLPHRQREVLVLRYYLDEPDAAIAATLGIAGSTVRSTLYRALARLGSELLGAELLDNDHRSSNPRRQP